MKTAAAHPVATPGYSYSGGRLVCRSAGRDACLASIADEVGTPCYVYDADGIRGRYESLHAALAPLGGSIRYALKANPCPAILELLVSLGAGMDVVSGGELERAWLAGASMDRVCMAGVAKSEAEMRAALDGRFSALAGLVDRDPSRRGSIGLFNVESVSELEVLEAVARGLGVRAPVAVRVNPSVDAGSHAHVRVGGASSKFGLSPVEAGEAARRVARSDQLLFRGLHMHIGSQIADLSCFDAALRVLTRLAGELESEGLATSVLDVGAGLAVSYMGEAVPTDDAFASVLAGDLAPWAERGAEILVEPGRELVAQAGVLLTRVRHVKRCGDRTFVITDAGLNALVRPALYGARHLVWPVACDPGFELEPIAPRLSSTGLESVDVVGPVCESSDVLLRDWPMPPIRRGDVLAVFTSGAYGMSMAMTFNDLPRPAEVMIDGGEARIVTSHQSMMDVLGVPGRGGSS